MTIRSKKREQCLDLLSAHVLEHGLSQTSLRHLADAAAVSDRMLLYYFENKTELMTEVLLRASAQMAAQLDAIVPADQRLSFNDLIRMGIEIAQSDDFQPFMQLSIEILARAGRGEQPYQRTSQLIIEGFRDWIEQRLDTPDPAQRRGQALMVLALIDGLAVVSPGLERSDIADLMAVLVQPF